MSEDKKRIKIYAADEITWGGSKVMADVGPRTDIKIDDGFKCEHGGYIPKTAIEPNHAPYCSLCYPYIVKLREDQ
jgi:hypothetical protein